MRNEQRTKHPIDLNKADAQELLSIEGIDGERARLILQFRERHGEFRRWDDVESVEGIGPTLIEKIKARAELAENAMGRGAEEQEEAGVQAAGEEEEGKERAAEEEEEDLESDEVLDSLMALAQLDGEAAVAYQIAIDQLDVPFLRDLLERFRGDHLRHVRDLNEVIERLGGAPIEAAPEPDESVLVRFTEAVGILGPHAVVLAMTANEQLTNATYETALEVAVESDMRPLIERNLEDERRHLGTLLELRDRDWEQEEMEEPRATD